MSSAALGGILAAALAAVAELLVFVGLDRPLSAGGRSLRVIAAAFIGGEAVLGMVIAILASTFGGDIPVPVAYASAGLIGAAVFGIAISFRRFVSLPGGESPEARSRTILRMAILQGLGVLGAVMAILVLVLSAP